MAGDWNERVRHFEDDLELKLLEILTSQLGHEIEPGDGYLGSLLAQLPQSTHLLRLAVQPGDDVCLSLQDQISDTKLTFCPPFSPGTSRAHLKPPGSPQYPGWCRTSR